jgi:hypothetical protein
MRRHDPQQHQQAKPVADPGTYSSEKTGHHVGDAGLAWALDFLSPHLDPRGRAIVAYGRLVARRHRVDMRSAIALARDVLTGETAESCEALSVLLDGDWDGALGDAVNAARRI